LNKLSVVGCWLLVGKNKHRHQLPSTFSLAAYRSSNFTEAGESTPATALFRQGLPGRGTKTIVTHQASPAGKEAFGLFTDN